MSILQSFEEFQKARVKFVQAVAEASTRPQNIEVMNNAGVMQLLRPLLLDSVRNFMKNTNKSSNNRN
jgi:Flp pilus assembly protein TadD